MYCDTIRHNALFFVAFNLERLICYLLSMLAFFFFLHTAVLTFYQNPLKEISEELQ